MSAVSSPPALSRTETLSLARKLAPSLRSQKRLAKERTVLLELSRFGLSAEDDWSMAGNACALLAEILNVGIFAAGLSHRAKLQIEMHSTGVYEPRGPRHEIELTPDESLFAHAMSSGEPVITPDIASDKRFRDEYLAECGVVSALALPLMYEGTGVGALVVGARERREFSKGDVEFCETICHMVASNCSQHRLRRVASEQQRAMEDLVNAVEDCTVFVDPKGNILRINRACQQLSKFSASEVLHRPFWSVFIAPGDFDKVRSVFQHYLIHGTVDPFQAKLTSKNGQERFVEWTLSSNRGIEGGIEKVVFVGNDQTATRDAERRAVDSETKLRRAIEQLKRLDHATQPAKKPPAFEEVPTKSIRNDLRTSPRRAYPYRQQIAPLTDGSLPAPEAFFEVPFRDISAGGVSFLLTYQPDFETVVVRLGQGRYITNVSANVVRIEEIKEDGKPAYLVGCRFTGRIDG